METENFTIDKRSKRILLAAAVIILSPLIAFVSWEICHGVSGNELILQNARSMSFHGKVDSIYFDQRNHNAKMLSLSDGYQYGLYREWDNVVSLGDSLSKDTGTLQVKVYKKNGKVGILDYKELVKNWK